MTNDILSAQRMGDSDGEQQMRDVGVRHAVTRRALEAPLWVAALALLIASGGCGDDRGSAAPTGPAPFAPSSSAPASSGAAPISGTTPMDPPATPPESEPASADPATPVGESPMSMVPLDPAPSAMDDDGDNAPDDAAEPEPSAEPEPAEPEPSVEPEPSEPEPSEPEPSEPEPEPEPSEPEPSEPEPPVPPAFSPCPSDGSPCRIMPLGDSITFGVGSRTPLFDQGGYRMELFRLANADGHPITFVGTQANGPADFDNRPFPRAHEGYSGSTINDGGNQLASRVDASIAATDPDIILLMIGTNDVNNLVSNPPSDLENLLDQIIDDAPDALLVVAQIVPTRTAGTNTRIQAYNANVASLVEELAAAGEHVVLVDMFSAFVSNPNFSTALLNDNLHPNDAGMVVMARTWYPAIESFLP
jgi:lysophospholipase L1-like esterase